MHIYIYIILFIFIIFFYYLHLTNNINIDIIKYKNNNIKFININNKFNIKYIHLNPHTKKTILYCQGYLENINLNFGLNKIKYLITHFKNYGIISFNYDNDIVNSSIAFFKYVISPNGLNINPNNIILYGKSMGSIITLKINKYLYKNNSLPCKIILESPLFKVSPFIDYFLKKNNINFLQELLIDIQYINVYTLILFGDKDFIIRDEQKNKIINTFNKYNKNNFLKFIILKNFGHNNLLFNKCIKYNLNLFIHNYK